jgi:soluble lytic murein transglycosylase
MTRTPRNRCTIRVRLGAPLLALLCAAAAAADDDPHAGVRQLFVLAYAAAEVGAPVPSAVDPAALRDYPLYPYLQRSRLTRALRSASQSWTSVDDDVRAFLDAHAGEPVAAELRAAWLSSLAAREQWQAVVERFDASIADPTLRCNAARAEIALAAPSATATATALWLTAERLPPECEPVFEWLRANDALTDDLVEQRVRALLENGETSFARTVAARLPQQRASALLQWADLLDRPAPSIDIALSDPARARRTDDAALLAGWTKLARNDPAAAHDRFERLAAAVGPERMGPYALALALGLAWDRRAAAALEIFAVVPAPNRDDYALTWQARAALWAGDWPQVERTIAAMSDEQREESRWRYWAARAAALRNDEQRAAALYASVLPSDNYYAANAAAWLKRRAEPHPEKLAVDDATIAALAARPEFVRARELFLSGLRGPAVTEWLTAFGSLDAAARPQAVHLASRWKWHDVSVATATRERVFYDYSLLYPQPYDREVQAAAKLTDLDASLIYGVIRQESLFRSDAVSPAGAVGLTQLIPETARRIARASRQPVPRVADLFDPGVSIKLGAAHLKYLVDRFDKQTIVALAGYNAGENAAGRWLPPRPIDADIWIENIPYNETRDYVQRVLWHTVVFGWLDTGRGESVESWLTRVKPLAPAQPAGDPAG